MCFFIFCLGRNRWNNRNKENSSANPRTNTTNWNMTSNGTNSQEFRPSSSQPNRFHNNTAGIPNQGTRNNYHKNNSHNGTYAYTQNGYQNGYGYQQQNGYSQGNYGGQQAVPYTPNRNYNTSGQRPNNGYQGQKYSRQNYTDTQGQGVYSVPPPFMMQPNTDAGVQTLINHKFFQPSRPPPQSNPCAYQNGYAAQYHHQAALPYAYGYSQPQAVQQ